MGVSNLSGNFDVKMGSFEADALFVGFIALSDAASIGAQIGLTASFSMQACLCWFEWLGHIGGGTQVIAEGNTGTFMEG